LVTEIPIDEADAERLRRLLSVEQRLQNLVRAAEQDSARRIAEALATRDSRLAAAHTAAEHADVEPACAERAVHEAALSSIATAHQAALVAITGLRDERVDVLARWALGEAIGNDGDLA
jgi:N-acetylglucosamine-6-phosphate deacetylase